MGSLQVGKKLFKGSKSSSDVQLMGLHLEGLKTAREVVIGLGYSGMQYVFICGS